MIKQPVFHEGAIIADNAAIYGDVEIGEKSSIWFHAVIRAEAGPVQIGKESNIQDNCTIHMDPGYPVRIGNRVTVGHGAVLHGCTVGDNTIIGMGAIVLNGAVIGRNCIIGAGALVTQNTVIPDNTVAFGNPCKPKKGMTEDGICSNSVQADEYVQHSAQYADAGIMKRY